VLSRIFGKLNVQQEDKENNIICSLNAMLTTTIKQYIKNGSEWERCIEGRDDMKNMSMSRP
jgi:hypothetical protein